VVEQHLPVGISNFTHHPGPATSHSVSLSSSPSPITKRALLTLLPTGKDGNGYQITPDLVLNRRAGRKQWSYSLDCKEIECQLKARQRYEQQSGLASYSLGAAFWEVRASEG
jgi:hypothetical protein